MPCFRQMSAVRTPDSCSLIIRMICSSLKRDLLILHPRFRGLCKFMAGNYGAGSSGIASRQRLSHQSFRVSDHLSPLVGKVAAGSDTGLTKAMSVLGTAKATLVSPQNRGQVTANSVQEQAQAERLGAFTLFVRG